MHRVLRSASLLASLTLLAVCPRAQASPDAGVGQGPDASVADGGTPAPCPDPAVVAQAVEADARLRASNECLPEELAKLSAAVKAMDQCMGTVTPARSWVFPVANLQPWEAIGGEGKGFVRNRGIQCYVTPWAGHPAHDLFVDDRYHRCQDKDGKPFPALAVEDGFVLVAHEGWTPEDKSRGGNYVMLYLPGRKQVTYYAHLDKVLVKAGEKVAAGQVVGTIGRTGKNAVPFRSQTHLHFGLWEAESFKPINSYSMLRSARTLSVTAQ